MKKEPRITKLAFFGAFADIFVAIPPVLLLITKTDSIISLVFFALLSLINYTAAKVLTGMYAERLHNIAVKKAFDEEIKAQFVDEDLNVYNENVYR